MGGCDEWVVVAVVVRLFGWLPLGGVGSSSWLRDFVNNADRSRQQAAGSRQQTADSRQQAGDRRPEPEPEAESEAGTEADAAAGAEVVSG